MCTLCSVSFDQTRADAFAGQLVNHLNSAGIMLMISIGHRTGLFDAMSDNAGYTSYTLADKARLNERYVREWLGAMVTGGIVSYDPQEQHYSLPTEHAAFLTRAASPNNLAASAQWVSVLGYVEDQVVDAFRHGRGVPYTAYNRFHEVMAEESNQSVIAGLDEHILPLVLGLVESLETGVEVADVGCGSGLALIKMAKDYPNSRFLGIDLSEEAIEFATSQAAAENVSNIRFESRDLTTWDATGAFDVIFTFDAIHDQARPDKVLSNIRRALKKGGVYLMQDIKASSYVDRQENQPLAPWIYTISCMHCMSVSLAQGGMGLGAAWGRELAVKMLDDAGFASIEVKELAHDPLNYYYINR
jgi:2-polyprenyl-3-methyl-5-hydroxy-6-metoxy-1,4-benzoquinol methylase